MDKMILVFSIIVACAIGIGTGLSLGAIQTGEMSGQINQMIRSISNNFSTLPQISETQNTTQQVVVPAKISFELTAFKVDPDQIPDSKDEYLANVVSSCAFHSDANIQTNSCVACMLQDENNLTVASGNVTLSEYDSSNTVPIKITVLNYTGANDFRNIKGVEIQVCDEIDQNNGLINNPIQNMDVEEP